MNFATNLWSAKLGPQTILNNVNIRSPGSNTQANLGSFGAFWEVVNTASPGDNAMLFDDLLITQQGTAPPNIPTEFTARSVGSSIVVLTWEEDLMAEQYEIQRSLDGVNNWTTVTTLTEDISFFIDAFLATNTLYFYRIRALSSVGNSEYFSPISARTFTEYENWKNGHLIEIDASDNADGDMDEIPLILEYALDLNPRRTSNSSLPRAVSLNGKPGLRYFRARTDANYNVKVSIDLINWSSAGVTQEADVLGLFVTAAVESPESRPYFFRLVVDEKE